MNKRTSTALAAIFGSLFLVLGMQQAVVTTTAAWTDRVNFTAPVSSGTWTTAQAKLQFTDNRSENSGTVGIFRHIVNVEHIYNGSNNPQSVSNLTVTVALPSLLFNGSPAAPTASGPWSFSGPPVKDGNSWNFAFTYTGTPLGLNGVAGVGTLNFPVQCSSSKNKSISVTSVASSPQAVASVSASSNTTLPNWQC